MPNATENNMDTLDVNNVVDQLDLSELDKVGHLDESDLPGSKPLEADESNESAPVVTAPAAVGVTAPTKADKAREIFARMYGKPNVARKDVINAFIAEAGLTKAGAGTYYQNFTKKLKDANAAKAKLTASE